MIGKTLRLLFYSICTLLFMHCSLNSRENNIAGGGSSEVENPITAEDTLNIIEGTLFTESGLLAKHATVHLIPELYIPLTTDSTFRTTNTDSAGSYSFINATAGSYNIQGEDSTGTVMFLKRGITVSQQSMHTVIDTIKPTGSLTVPIDSTLVTTNGFLYIQGTTIYQSITSENDLITFPAIPTSIVPSIHWRDTITEYSTTLIDTVLQIRSGDTTLAHDTTTYHTLLIVMETDSIHSIYDKPFIERLSNTNYNHRFISQSKVLTPEDTLNASAIILLPSSTMISTVYSALPIPILSMASEQFDLLGYTNSDDANTSFSSIASASGTTLIEITDPLHTLASGLTGPSGVGSSSGAITVSLSDSPYLFGYGIPNSNATSIISTTETQVNSILFFYSKGVEMYNGTAADKRIALAYSTTQVASLTESGMQFFENCIHWMMP